MLHSFNNWAKRWGPLIALAGTFFAGVAIVIEKAPSESGHLNPTLTEPDVSSAPPTDRLDNEVGASEPAPLFLPHTPASIAQNYDRLNVIGLQHDCSAMLANDSFLGLSTEDRAEVERLCLKASPRSFMVAHFSSKIRGREGEILSKSPILFSLVSKTPTIIATDSSKCEAVSEKDFGDVVFASWSLVALKAFWIAESFGLGNEVVKRLLRGIAPEDSLPDLPLAADIPKVEYLTTSFQIISTYQIDQFLKIYTDEQLLGYAEIILDTAPSTLRSTAKRSIELFLDHYDKHFLPNSGDMRKLYPNVYSASEYAEFKAGPLVGNSPKEIVYTSCLGAQMNRFWFRRLQNGTDDRIAKLARMLLARNSQSGVQ